MKDNIENKLLEKYKMYVAVSKFENDLEKEENKRTNKYPLNNMFSKWREYTMKKRLIITTALGIFLVSGVAFATNIDSVKNYFRGLGGGIDTAVEYGYIENTEMNYIDNNASVSNEPDKIIDNINLEAKIEDFLMDDYNLSVEFDFKFDDEMNKYVDLDNIHNIELKDLIVRDEENRIIYAGNDKEVFDEYCNKYNLDYTYGEFNENYLNNGLNCFPSYHNKEDKVLKLMYNMYTNKYPNSKKLYFSFGKLIITEEDNENVIELKGNWNIDLDVPEKMYNRTSESYKVVSCSNSDFNVYASTVSDTGFEIGVIINNIEKVKYPEEIRKIQLEISQKYENVFDQNSNKEFYERISQSPYKEIYNEYLLKENPINYAGIQYREITENGLKVEEGNTSYVENSNGEQFKCTLSPSRKSNGEWLDGNRYDFYETFGMTKYEATDKIKVVLYYYGEPVTIELERN